MKFIAFTALVLAITNRATTLNSQNEMDKNSNHNSVRVLAWYLACLHASGYNVHLFKVYLLTECAYLKCEPQGGENMSAELSSHTSSFCFNHNKLQLFALALCAPLPTRQKTSLSSLIYKHKFACFCRAGALVCVVQATAPCCCGAGAQRTVA